MGTKVEIENYFPGDYSMMRDVSRETNGSGWASCYSDMNMPNGGQFYYGFAPKTLSDVHPGYESYDKDVVKQTMLRHEVVFKDQVYELHRLYRVQRDLMDEVRRKEQFKQYTPYEASSSSAPLPSNKQLEDAQRWNGSNYAVASQVNSSLNSVKGKNVHLGPNVYQNSYSPKNSEVSESRKQMIDLQLPADEYIDTDATEEFGRKNDFEKIHEISGENGKKGLADLNEPFCVEETSTLIGQGNGLYRDHRMGFLSCSNDIPENSKRSEVNGFDNIRDIRGNGQDWFYCVSESENCKPEFRTANHGIHPEKAHVPSQPAHMRNSIILGPRPASTETSPFDLNKWNLNYTPEANAVFDNDPALRNGFYQGSSSVKEMDLNVALSNGASLKHEIIDGNCTLKDPLTVLPWLRGKRDINLPCEPIDFNHSSRHEEILPRKRKNYFDINVPCEPFDEEVDVDQRESKTSGSVKNHFDLNSSIIEEEIPCETSKVNTGIDLESTPSPENEEIFEAELIKLAASSIVEISSCVDEVTTFPLLEEEDDDPLNWFVSIACSSGTNPQPDDNDGLDDFENMILRLKECKPEDYFPSPSTPDFLFSENVLASRTRRGPGRRAKQRRDFQRDILPGLTTLSRHDVTEDLQIFGGLMRATGYSWHSAPNRTRNKCGRGRRKSMVETPPISSTVCALPLKPPGPPPHEMVVEVGLEERSLTGWGKTTRRPRRQRCPSGNCTLPLHLS